MSRGPQFNSWQGHRVQTGSAVYPVSYPMGTQGSFLRGTAPLNKPHINGEKALLKLLRSLYCYEAHYTNLPSLNSPFWHFWKFQQRDPLTLELWHCSFSCGHIGHSFWTLLPWKHSYILHQAVILLAYRFLNWSIIIQSACEHTARPSPTCSRDNTSILGAQHQQQNESQRESQVSE